MIYMPSDTPRRSTCKSAGQDFSADDPNLLLGWKLLSQEGECTLGLHGNCNFVQAIHLPRGMLMELSNSRPTSKVGPGRPATAWRPILGGLIYSSAKNMDIFNPVITIKNRSEGLGYEND
jgi:hypothetical protein